jgi:hypothetical protein
LGNRFSASLNDGGRNYSASIPVDVGNSGRRQDKQLDPAAFGFALYLFSSLAVARAGADDEPTAFSRVYLPMLKLVLR